MKCPKCGNTNIQSGMKFCTKCGHPLNLNSDSSQPSKIVTPRPIPSLRPMPTPISSASGDKGLFSTIGAAIQGARQGVERQHRQEDEMNALIPMAQFKVRDAGKQLTNLIKKYGDKVSAEDESIIVELIGSLKAAIADENASKIKKTISELDKAIYALEEKLGASHSGDNDGSIAPKPENHQPQVVELHDVNEDELAVVRNKAIWGIQRGQIARRITEREIDSAEKLNGFIIQQGCSAMIFVNGALIDVFEAGAYDVPQKNEQRLKAEYKRIYDELANKSSEKESSAKPKERSIAERGGLLGIAGGALRRGWEFIFGATPKSKENHKNRDELRLRKLKAETEKLLKQQNPVPLMSIILVSNRVITLAFGGISTPDGSIDPQPYKIKSRVLDLNMGVRLQMKISDISMFATNYLTDHNSFSTLDLFYLLNPTIENVLTEQMRNIDFEATGLSPEMQAALRSAIFEAINREVFGMECTQVLQITYTNEEFERFRELDRALYCSEKELDYMQRTGEFRNRFETLQNTQALQSAQTTEDYRYACQQINKDQLLHDDELEDFVRMLESQKRIKEAASQEQEYEALLDLRKNRWTKDDEMDALQDALEHERIPRHEITEIMRLQSAQRVEKERLLAEWANGDMITDHDWEREDMKRRRSWGIEDEERERQWTVEDQTLQRRLENLKRQDVYDDQRDEYKYHRDFERMAQLEDYKWQMHVREEKERRENEELEYNRRRQDEETIYSRNRTDKFDDVDILARKAAIARENMQIMQAHQLELEEKKHQEEMARIEVQRHKDDVEVNMSAEQLRERNRQNLAEAAQVASFGIEGAQRENELRAQQQQEQKELYDKMLAMQQAQDKDTKDTMLEMARMMQQGMIGVGAQQASSQQQMFQQQQQFQQQRLEDQQQRANEYREDARHQQQRMDHTQDMAMGSMAQVNTAAASNLSTDSIRVDNQLQSTAVNEQLYACPYCGQPIHLNESFCPNCGKAIDWQV